MKAATPTPRARLKALRDELLYWQTQARLEASALMKTRQRIKDIAARMREAYREALTKRIRNPYTDNSKHQS